MKSLFISKIIETNKLPFLELLETRGCIYTFLNPVSYLTALKEKDLFFQFDGIFADGSILTNAIRIVYWEKIIRRSFDMTSLAPQLFKYTEQNNKSIYLIGAKQEEIERAILNLKEHFPQINVAGFRNGYFNNREEIEFEVYRILEVSPDFLIIGMGIKMQEKFLIRMRDAGFNGIGFTCGGFLSQTAMNKIDYYPQWADRWNLRFIYRMYKEKHTRKRYLIAGFVFPSKFIFERIFGK